MLKKLFMITCLIPLSQMFGDKDNPSYSEIEPIVLNGIQEAAFIKSNSLAIFNKFAEISQIFEAPSKVIDEILSTTGNQISNRTFDNTQNDNFDVRKSENVGKISTTSRPSTAFTQTFNPTIPFPTGIPDILTNVSAGCLADFYMILSDARTFQFFASINCSNANATLEEMCNAYKGEELTKVAYIFALFDSFGKLGSGISDGNSLWLGNWHECRGISVTEGRNSFKGQYCRSNLYMTIIVTPAVFKYGLCVPSTCDSTDVDYLSYYGLELLSSNPTYGQITAGMALYGAVCYPDRHVLDDTKAVATIVILAIWLTVLVFATAFDVLDHQPRMKSLQRRTQNYEVKQALVGTPENDTLAKPETEAEYLKKAPLLTQILLGLSLYSNFLKIMSTERRPGSFDCIHGIRFLSMSWVILGHTYFYALGTTDNLSKIPEMLKEPTLMTVVNATVSVDSFFVISGILLTYLWLTEVQKSKGKMLKNGQSWFLYYFHRYVRLTPVYMIIMGVEVALFKYLGYGPLWNSDGVEPENCKYWWHNLLYINNFFDTTKVCMGHTWFLANDMQFHVVAPILLVSIYYFPAFAMGLASLVILGSAAWRGYYFVHYDYMPSNVMTLYPGYNQHGASFKDVYEAPWMRAGPYVWGLMVGYVMFTIKRKQVRINKLLNLALWAFFIAVLCAVVYGMYPYVGTDNRVPKAVQGLYGAVNRTVWGIGVSWIVFACMTGNGGFIDSFLAWPGFFPLSRLTYCAYLVHPYVMQLIYYSVEVPVHLSTQYTMVYYFLANECIAYATALVFSLSFEATFMNLEKVFLQSLMPKKSEKPPETSRTDNSASVSRDFSKKRKDVNVEDNELAEDAKDRFTVIDNENGESSNLTIVTEGIGNPTYVDSGHASSSKDSNSSSTSSND